MLISTEFHDAMMRKFKDAYARDLARWLCGPSLFDPRRGANWEDAVPAIREKLDDPDFVASVARAMDPCRCPNCDGDCCD